MIVHFKKNLEKNNRTTVVVGCWFYLAKKNKTMETKRVHFEHFTIAGLTYYDGVLVFNELQIGTELRLVAEPTNQFDKNAVIIYLGENKLGYIPRANNRAISKMLIAGYNVFKVFIQMVNPHKSPEEQVQVIVFIESAFDEKEL
jgi:hypothetical protein